MVTSVVHIHHHLVAHIDNPVAEIEVLSLVCLFKPRSRRDGLEDLSVEDHTAGATGVDGKDLLFRPLPLCSGDKLPAWLLVPGVPHQSHRGQMLIDAVGAMVLCCGLQQVQVSWRYGI